MQVDTPKRREGRVNHNFVQLTVDYLPEWRALTRKNPVAAEILFFMIEHMGKGHNALVISQATMMELTGRSRSTVSRAVRELKEARWIDVVQVGTTSAYAVNARVAWRTHANQKDYALFSATVVASSTEQKERLTSKLRHIPTMD